VAVATPSRLRVRHSLRPARWPTREEAAQPKWFSPVRLGPRCVTAERTWVPAMVPWRATEDGHVTPEVLDWYARFAEGQPGVLVVEATGIRDVPSGPLLRIGSDRFIPGLRRLVETVRERSEGRTRLFIQVIDFVAVRRRPEPTTYFARYLEIGPGLRDRLLWDRDLAPDDPDVRLANDGRRRLTPPSWRAPAPTGDLAGRARAGEPASELTAS
jgi:dimethylglycine catabolism A